jgi:hypothetical protein
MTEMLIAITIRNTTAILLIDNRKRQYIKNDEKSQEHFPAKC